MPPHWTRRHLLGVGGTALAAVAGCLGAPSPDQAPLDNPLPVSNAHQYSAPGCSCCHTYADYLEDSLPVPLERSEPTDVGAVKRQHGVPGDLQSCHTLVLDEYVVEGHVPASVIATLFDTRPAIDGVALPGMPAGSPGMGGQQQGPFTVYALGGGRTGEVFATV